MKYLGLTTGLLTAMCLFACTSDREDAEDQRADVTFSADCADDDEGEVQQRLTTDIDPSMPSALVRNDPGVLGESDPGGRMLGKS